MVDDNLKKARVEYLDILRGIGILLMIMGHIGFSEYFDIYIHTFHMPLFFIISGFLFNLERNPSTGLYIRKKAKTLLVPFFIFALMHTLIYLIFHNVEFAVVVQSLFYSNHQTVYIAGALWFLFCLFIVDVMFYLLIKYGGKYTGVVILAVAVAGCFISIELPLTLDSAMIGIGMYFIGFLLKQNSEHPIVNKYFLEMSIPMLIVLFVVHTALSFLNGSVNLRTCIYSNASMFWFNAVVGSMCYWNIAGYLQKIKLPFAKSVSSILKSVGRNSIIYVCLNQVVILVLAKSGHIFLGTLEGVVKYIVNLGILPVAMVLLWFLARAIGDTKLKVLIGK